MSDNTTSSLNSKVKLLVWQFELLSAVHAVNGFKIDSRT